MKRLFQLIVKKIIQIFEGISKLPFKKFTLDVFKFIGDIIHRALFNVLLPKRFRTLTKKEIYTIIFKSDTPRGKKFDVWLLILITLNILVITLESISVTPEFESVTGVNLSETLVSTPQFSSDSTMVLDSDGLAITDGNTSSINWFVILMRILGWGFTIIFTFEFYLRVYCLEHPKKYLLSFFGIIDIVSIFPAYFSLFFPAASTLSVLRLMRILRVFRIYRMQRFIDEGKFMVNALRRSSIKIVVFMLFVFVTAIILGSAMYGIEGGKNPAISSIPRGVYWAVVTITTVGYGDITPVTSLGQFISVVVMLLGYSIIAVPTGIVAGETIEEHKQSRRRNKKKNFSQEQISHSEDKPESTTNQNPTSKALDPGVEASPDDLW